MRVTLWTGMLRLLCSVFLPLSTRHTADFQDTCWVRPHTLFPALLRYPSASLYDIAFVEEPVYFLERQIRCFGIAEILQSLSHVIVRWMRGG
jgi:hypothetical protein